jgi:hypothetical protein
MNWGSKGSRGCMAPAARISNTNQIVFRIQFQIGVFAPIMDTTRYQKCEHLHGILSRVWYPLVSFAVSRVTVSLVVTLESLG